MCVIVSSFLCLSPQPEEYGQEAMEGQGEAMLEPEGETYDETQQVHDTKHAHASASLRMAPMWIAFCMFCEKPSKPWSAVREESIHLQ